MNYKEIAYILERNSKCYSSLSVYTTEYAIYIETDSIERVIRLEKYLNDCNIYYNWGYGYNNQITYGIPSVNIKYTVNRMLGGL